MSEHAESAVARSSPTFVMRSVQVDFEVFFEQQYERLFGALTMITRNREESEDIAQEAFLRLWERRDHFGDLENPVGYLYRIAMNDFRRRRRRAILAMKRTIGLAGPDHGMADIDANDLVMRAMAGLSDRQRASVVLTDLLEFSSEEAGRMLGMTASTVRSHVARAHVSLRTTMGDER
jgi:RNA polymerase sigma-70 factor, ECF subfamily